LMGLRQSLHHLCPHSFPGHIINLRSPYSGRLMLILSLHLSTSIIALANKEWNNVLTSDIQKLLNVKVFAILPGARVLW
jgi:hypothetical protein